MNREKTEFIVIHTAAAAYNKMPIDQSAETIKLYHEIHNGWSDIGYHYVIRMGGAIEVGRPQNEVGAHVLGLNDRSLGICLSGHGDISAPPPEQWASLLTLTQQMMSNYNIPVEKVIGHREASQYLPPHLEVYKTCPGTKCDMDKLRAQLQASTPTLKIDEKLPVIFYDKEGEHITQDVRTYQNTLNVILDSRNQFLLIDGWAGKKTSDATKMVLGHYLVGDPRG